MLLETLESRQMMSATPCVVNCTPAADTIVVSVKAGVLNVKVDGIIKASVKTTLVSNLVLNGCGGSDVVELVGCTVPVTCNTPTSCFSNVPACHDGSTTFLNLGIRADVSARLGLSQGINVGVNAKIDAVVGLLSRLQINGYGQLCSSTNVVVDVTQCRSLLASLGVKTGVAINNASCLNVCAAVGIKASASLSILNQLSSCTQQLATLGVHLDLGLTLGGLLSIL